MRMVYLDRDLLDTAAEAEAVPEQRLDLLHVHAAVQQVWEVVVIAVDEGDGVACHSCMSNTTISYTLLGHELVGHKTNERTGSGP